MQTTSLHIPQLQRSMVLLIIAVLLGALPLMYALLRGFVGLLRKKKLSDNASARALQARQTIMKRPFNMTKSL